MLVHWKSESDKNVIFPLKSFYRALKSIDKDSKIIWSFGKMCEVYNNIRVCDSYITWSRLFSADRI